jgi:hypothetical protein
MPGGETISEVSDRRRDARFLHLLRVVALIAVPAGAVGSVGLMLHAGRHSPRVLLLLMALWVLSPFVVFVVADVVSKRWPVATRAALHCAMVVVALGSLAVYTVDALRPPKAQAAFVFVAVPPVSWLLTAMIVSIATLISGRMPRRGDAA